MITLAFIKRIGQQLFRDKRTLGLMMVAPLLVMTLMHFLFTGDTANPVLGVSGADATLTKDLKAKDIDIKKYSSVSSVKKTIINDKLDGFLTKTGDTYKLTLKNTDPAGAKGLQMKIQQIIAAETAQKQKAGLASFMTALQTKLHGGPPLKLETVNAPKVNTAYIYGSKDTSFFDLLGPILVGFFVFFFVFLISGIALLRERTTGTLDRLLATPIKRHNIVFGYLSGYGLFAIVQTVIVVLYAVKVLDIVLVGSIGYVILINLMLALVALSLGILLSAFANSEFQMMQFIPVVIIPQIFFAGILQVDGMAGWLQVIAKCMPMYYGGDALQAVMYKGLGWSDIQRDIFVLLGFAIVFIVLNVFALRKYRKI
jgi:ABC-2 type transport system permease protein